MLISNRIQAILPKSAHPFGLLVLDVQDVDAEEEIAMGKGQIQAGRILMSQRNLYLAEGRKVRNQNQRKEMVLRNQSPSHQS